MKKFFIITHADRWNKAGAPRRFLNQQEINRHFGPGGGVDRAGIMESNALPPPLRSRGAA